MLPPLVAAARRLQAEEEAARGKARWTLAEALTPFSALAGRGFPVVLSSLAAGRPAASRLPPSRVAPRLAEVFAGA